MRLNWIHPYDDGNGRTSRAADVGAMEALLSSLLAKQFALIHAEANTEADEISSVSD